MSYRADKLGDGRTDWRTDAGNDNTRRPILASGKKRESVFLEIKVCLNPALDFAVLSIFIFIKQ